MIQELYTRIQTSIMNFIGINHFQDYLLFCGLFVIFMLLFLVLDKVVFRYFFKLSKKTKFKFDDFFIGFLNGLSWLFYAYLSLYFSAQFLTLTPLIEKILYYLLVICIGFYIGKGITGVVDMIIKKKLHEKTQKEEVQNTSMIKVLGLFAKVFVWLLLLLLVLSNMGVEITPLIAGLGIGGIAIALALQTILGDLFNAFVIYFDKPFQEGDFIIVDGNLGVVKQIGIKTTRVQALEGHELVFANSMLTSSVINNYKKMENRRVVFKFGVVYNTSPTKLRKIKTIMESIVKDLNKEDKRKKGRPIKFDRIHFKSFGESSYDYEVVYYLPTPDYNIYMDTQEEMNLRLTEAFAKEKIEFAYPTRTIYMAN